MKRTKGHILRGTIRLMEAQLMETIRAWHGQSPPVDQLFTLVARHSALVFASLFGGALLYRYHSSKHPFLPSFLLTLFMLTASLAANRVLRVLFARERPFMKVEEFLSLIYHSATYSFPSNHATACFAITAAVFYLVNARAAVVVFLLSVMVVFSRVYVGVHYPTDILAGLVTAAVVCGLTLLFRNRLFALIPIIHGGSKKSGSAQAKKGGFPCSIVLRSSRAVTITDRAGADRPPSCLSRREG